MNSKEMQFDIHSRISLGGKPSLRETNENWIRQAHCNTRHSYSRKKGKKTIDQRSASNLSITVTSWVFTNITPEENEKWSD